MMSIEARHLGSSSFNTESGDASINLNANARDGDEDDVEELPRPIGREKAKGLKKKVTGSSLSPASMNDEALARLMVSELATQSEIAMAMKKEEHATFLEIKMREVECRERENAMQEYIQHQEDIRTKQGIRTRIHGKGVNETMSLPHSHNEDQSAHGEGNAWNKLGVIRRIDFMDMAYQTQLQYGVSTSVAIRRIHDYGYGVLVHLEGFHYRLPKLRLLVDALDLRASNAERYLFKL
ncbi:hypothetical protein Tco_0921764 [Tanacetum coccineum]